MCAANLPRRSPWERCPSKARTERAGEGTRTILPPKGRKALSVTFGDSSPRGRAKGVYFGTKNGAYRFRYAPFTISRPPLRPLGDFSICQKVPTFIGRKQASFGRQKRRSFRCAAYRLLVNRAADYSLGPASTRALPASLPSYLTKFLTNRPARSLALVSHSSTLV